MGTTLAVCAQAHSARGFSHQFPGFIYHVANKQADIVRIYLPPDANCLLSVTDHCLRSRIEINAGIAGKQPEWHQRHVSEQGDDLPEVKTWRWTPGSSAH